jgi:hypothetical protein
MLMKSVLLYPDSFLFRLWRIALILLIFVMPLRAVSQKFILHNEQPVAGIFLGEDALGNRYSLERGVLRKINPTGQILSYSNRQYGEISSADITDPMNLVVFFRDFGVVASLDNKLTEKNIYTPQLLHDNDVAAAVSYSFQKGFWLYFPSIFRLTRYSTRPDVVSQDLSLNPGISSDVLFLKEHNERVFLLANHLMVFDIHANFLFSIQHIRTPLLQLKENKIFYLKEDQLYVYDFFLKKEDVFLLPESGIHNFFVKDESTIYLQTGKTLKEYQLTGVFY